MGNARGLRPFTYELTTDDTIAELLAKKGRQSVLLSTAMATPDELRLALPASRYLLRKRTGFVQSKNYEETLVKKKDFYSFAPRIGFRNLLRALFLTLVKMVDTQSIVMQKQFGWGVLMGKNL